VLGDVFMIRLFIVLFLSFLSSSVFAVDPSCASSYALSSPDSSSTRSYCDAKKGTYLGSYKITSVCWKNVANQCLQYTTQQPGACTVGVKTLSSGDLICSSDCEILTPLKEFDIFNSTSKTCVCPSGTITVTYSPAPTDGSPTQYCGTDEPPPPPPPGVNCDIETPLILGDVPSESGLDCICPPGQVVGTDGVNMSCMSPANAATGCDLIKAAVGSESITVYDSDGNAIGFTCSCPSGTNETQVYDPDTGQYRGYCVSGGGCPAGHVFGEVNGSATCVPDSGAPPVPVDTSTQSDTAVTSVTNPDGTTTTTTVTTTTTTNNSGSTTQTTSTSVTKDAAGNVISSSETGTGTGVEESTETSISGGGTCGIPPACVGADFDCQVVFQLWKTRCVDESKKLSDITNCDAPFQCSGDAIACGLAKSHYQLTCTPEVNPADLKQQIDSQNAADGLVSLDDVVASQESSGFVFDDVKDLSNDPAFQIDEGSFLGSECPVDIPLDLGQFGVVSLPISDFCDLFAFIGFLIQLSATIAAVRLNYQAIMGV